MAVALLLSGPYWVRKGNEEKGWVLADAGAMDLYGVKIDSLVKAGWDKKELDSINYWNGFRVADGTAPSGVEFMVFSSGLQRRFEGARPTTDRVVHWEVYAPKDSLTQWTEKSWSLSADSSRVIRGVAGTTGSVYHYETAAMKADTNTLDLTIYTDVIYKQDGRYLAAALRAVQEFTRRRMRVVVTDNVSTGRGWLFWLSAKPLPAVNRFDKIWRYGIGDGKKIDTWMEGAELYREIFSQGGGEVVWKDGYGRGVLVRDGVLFSFYSRLNPDWGELVWSRQFPALLARLLFGEEGPGKRDLRMMDAAQVTPVRGETLEAGWREGEKSELAMAGAVDLGKAAWIVVFILFILERWLSGRE